MGAEAARHLSGAAGGIAVIGPREPDGRKNHHGVFAATRTTPASPGPSMTISSGRRWPRVRSTAMRQSRRRAVFPFIPRPDASLPARHRRRVEAKSQLLVEVTLQQKPGEHFPSSPSIRIRSLFREAAGKGISIHARWCTRRPSLPRKRALPPLRRPLIPMSDLRIRRGSPSLPPNVRMNSAASAHC